MRRSKTSSSRSTSIRRWTNAAGAIRRASIRRADAGQIRNFTGIDAPYEPPEAPEIHLPTLEAPAEALAERIFADLRRRGIVA